MSKQQRWMTLILLTAAALRLFLLSQAPPGLTHDEADHGLDAWGVVNGIRPLYFTVGYGREPFFDYATAGLMALIGPTWLAGRLTAVFLSLIMLAATAAWTRRAFGRNVALLTAAGLAVSFWGVMTGRHALRSVAMPALFALAVLIVWPAVQRLTAGQPWRRALTAGALTGLTFYTYMPSRLLWAVWPGLALFWALRDRARLRALWRPLTALLATAGLIGLPLFLYLRRTGAEARIDQLRGPLDAARQGDWGPLARNAWGALQLFFVQGDAGPVAWRYNIPGRPWLDPVMAALFLLGLWLALRMVWRNPSAARRSAAVLALLWLVGGLTPSLITGPEAATTRAIALQPVLYLFPALALTWLGRRSAVLPSLRRFRPWLAALLFAAQGVLTAHAYFVVWANDPNVRVHYEAARVAGLRYLNDHPGVAAAMASPAPNRFHDPALGPLFLRDPARPLRWFDGRGSLLLPATAESLIVLSPWGVLAPELQPLWECPAGPPCPAPPAPEAILPLRPDDLDRPVTIYRRNTAELAAELAVHRFTPLEATTFGEYVVLLGYRVARQTPDLAVLTLWRVQQPLDGLVLFTHLRATADQPPLANADRLDAPSYYWQPGDWFVQLHVLPLPAERSTTPLELVVGAYTRPDPATFLRLPAFRDGAPVGDSVLLTTLMLAP